MYKLILAVLVGVVGCGGVQPVQEASTGQSDSYIERPVVCHLVTDSDNNVSSVSEFKIDGKSVYQMIRNTALIIKRPGVNDAVSSTVQFKIDGTAIYNCPCFDVGCSLSPNGTHDNLNPVETADSNKWNWVYFEN